MQAKTITIIFPDVQLCQLSDSVWLTSQGQQLMRMRGTLNC